jgi:hypothetical protein
VTMTPTLAARPDGALTSIEVAEATGLSYRQIDYAVRVGWISPSVHPGHGGGSVRWWSKDDALRLRLVKARLDWGLTYAAAWRTVDPPLPTLHEGAVK